MRVEAAPLTRAGLGEGRLFLSGKQLEDHRMLSEYLTHGIASDLVALMVLVRAPAPVVEEAPAAARASPPRPAPEEDTAWIAALPDAAPVRFDADRRAYVCEPCRQVGGNWLFDAADEQCVAESMETIFGAWQFCAREHALTPSTQIALPIAQGVGSVNISCLLSCTIAA